MKHLTTNCATAAVLLMILIGRGNCEDTVRAPSAADSNGGNEEESQVVSIKAREFLTRYQAELAKLEIRANLAAWQAANTGKKEDFDASAEASLSLRKFHSDPAVYKELTRLIGTADQLPPVEMRALRLAELAYKKNQLPPKLLAHMVTLSTDIERSFNTFRGEIDRKRLSNNDLLDMLRKEDDSDRRRKIWDALKQVGGAVAPRLVELARLRNQGAKSLGFENYWDMQIQLQEHDPQQLIALFEELERLTREPFSKMKAAMDRELAKRFDVEPQELMPWHYDNPFFQAPPPSDAVDLNEFYEHKTKEAIVEISREFYADIGLPVEGILKRSDLYEREGKDQHAFCVSIDREDDVRTLCNVKPTAEWMDTMLHELGHAVYDFDIDRGLPYNLREPAHALTTEGVAMLFGALAKTPTWMVAYADADESRVSELAGPILEERRREQLVFARWTMVMLHFEKALYEDPEQDLNAFWWDCVERYQQLRRPEGRSKPDWAAKPHFTIAPVYYHNYMMGELFAAQLRHVLSQLANHRGPASQLSFNGRKEFGEFLKEKAFRPGSITAWPEFVRRATGEPLTAKYFAAEVR